MRKENFKRDIMLAQAADGWHDIDVLQRTQWPQELEPFVKNNTKFFEVEDLARFLNMKNKRKGSLYVDGMKGPWSAFKEHLLRLWSDLA